MSDKYIQLPPDIGERDDFVIFPPAMTAAEKEEFKRRIKLADANKPNGAASPMPRSNNG